MELFRNLIEVLKLPEKSIDVDLPILRSPCEETAIYRLISRPLFSLDHSGRATLMLAW